MPGFVFNAGRTPATVLGALAVASSAGFCVTAPESPATAKLSMVTVDAAAATAIKNRVLTASVTRVFLNQFDELRRRHIGAHSDALEIEPAERVRDDEQRQIRDTEDLRLRLSELEKSV